MKSMKAVGFYEALDITNPQSMVDITLPIPTPEANDLLVKVEAISVNPADYRVRKRKVHDGLLSITGWDVAGTIVAKGDLANTFQIGDAVYYAGDLTRTGANSEYHLVDARLVGNKPIQLDMSQAAAIPLTALTAWEVLFEHFHLDIKFNPSKKILLIIGGAGGVGSMLIQLAKLVPNLLVIATASRDESKQWCLQMGADLVINHHENIVTQLHTYGISAIDMALLANEPDPYWSILPEILAPFGKICSLVPFTNAPDLNILMQKSISMMWEFMFTRPMFKTIDQSKHGAILNQISKLLDEGKLVSTGTQNLGSINAKNLRHAHRLLESSQTIGKLTLTGFN